ncbi:MAG TPA: trypsin-like peptidase domain-containing protein [Candidatus Nanopelagicaceae bacterium]
MSEVDPSSETAPKTPSQSPWWVSDSQPLAQSFSPALPIKRALQVTWYMALAMSLIAGVVGAVIGKATFDNSSHLISSSQVIDRAPNSIAAIAARVSPSVVEVDSSTSTGSDTGSGFFIEANGYIMTNNHVIEAAVLDKTKITVKLSNNHTYIATVVGRDTAYDLAVIKIEVTGAPALILGNSNNVQVGDPVIAIGSPLGLQGTVTSGIISAKNRPVTTSSDSTAGESAFIDALQTDAAINPGNSGGPLVDATGAVIGVNSAIASLGSSFAGQPGSIGLGFAIPINQAKTTADQLIKTGHSHYPIVGMSLDSSFAGPGAKIADLTNSILPGGPAAKAGLRSGDIILAIDGQDIATADDLIVAIRSHSIGDTITLKYQRGTVTKTVQLTLAASK